MWLYMSWRVCQTLKWKRRRFYGLKRPKLSFLGTWNYDGEELRKWFSMYHPLHLLHRSLRFLGDLAHYLLFCKSVMFLRKAVLCMLTFSDLRLVLLNNRFAKFLKMFFCLCEVFESMVNTYLFSLNIYLIVCLMKCSLLFWWYVWQNTKEDVPSLPNWSTYCSEICCINALKYEF